LNFAYIDESEGLYNKLAYTSVTASIFLEDIIYDFQHEISQSINEIYFPGEAERNHIHMNPVFHASELPRNQSDEDNLKVVEAISRLSKDYGVEIIRVGYFDESFAGGMGDSRHRRLDTCLHNITYPNQALARSGMCYVYELDGPSHHKLNGYGSGGMVDSVASTNMNNDQHSFLNYNKIFGRFFCEKHNQCMYVSDLAAYLLKLRTNNNLTDFQKEYLSSGKDLIECVLIDEIVYWNEKSKTIKGNSRGLETSRHYFGTRKWKGTVT